MKTPMQQHLEWLKVRIVVTEAMEQELLSQEKKAITDAYKADSRIINTEEKAENYFNKTYN
jgi:DNA replicative helicase MCM subunit Mcm2 (Cdc46/Mcm family)